LKFLETFSKKFLSGVQGQSPAASPPRLPDKSKFEANVAVLKKANNIKKTLALLKI
jgi:hypothetical protein